MDLPNLSCSFLTGSRPEKEGQRSTPTGISHFSWCVLFDKTVEEVSILYARSSSSGKRWKSLDIGGWGSSLYPPDFDAWQDRQGLHLSQHHKFFLICPMMPSFQFSHLSAEVKYWHSFPFWNRQRKPCFWCESRSAAPVLLGCLLLESCELQP